MNNSEKVEAYLKKHSKWEISLSNIRKSLIGSGFKEEVKWGMPTYTIDGKNLIGLSGFKNHFGVWFHQGVFLSDTKNLLVNAQEGKTKGMRHMKYSDTSEVDLDVLKSYFEETIKNHNDGKEVKVVRKKLDIEMPNILEEALGDEGMIAFNKLTPAKRNDFKEYIVTAKREATQKSRLEKILPLIHSGKGIDHLYKKQ